MKILTRACQKFGLGLLKSYLTFGYMPSSVRSKKKILHPTNQTEEKAKVVPAGWGTRLIPFHAALCRDLAPGWFEEKVNRRKDTWWNGCFGKMDDQSVLTTPNQHTPKMGDLQKCSFKSSVLLNGNVTSTSPQTAATTSVFPSVWFFVYGPTCLPRGPSPACCDYLLHPEMVTIIPCF